MTTRSRPLFFALLVVVGVLLASCATAPRPTLPPAQTPTPGPAVTGAALFRKEPPVPVQLPADEAPHDVLTEWWYYTGHLDADNGARYGFEFVVFQVRLGDRGPSYISHVAITDMTRSRFVYDQRATHGVQPQPADGGFALNVGDWTMRGRDGRDQLGAGVDQYRFELSLMAQKPPVKHLGAGYMSFGPAGDSYYYSRTRMAVTGTLEENGVARHVTGAAWFDKQWGNFISVKSGGWDWYALQLDDGVDIMVFDVRDPSGRTATMYGTYVDADGKARDLLPDQFTVEATGQWTSARTGATYPSGWRVRVPAERLDVTVTPVLLDQELDTRPTTGVVYWEGAVTVAGQRAGRDLSGRGYVELTGYLP